MLGARLVLPIVGTAHKNLIENLKAEVTEVTARSNNAQDADGNFTMPVSLLAPLYRSLMPQS